MKTIFFEKLKKALDFATWILYNNNMFLAHGTAVQGKDGFL